VHRLLTGLFVVVLGGCRDGGAHDLRTLRTGQPAFGTLQPDVLVLEAGSTTRLVPRLHDGDGVALGAPDVSFTSTAPQVAGVDARGVVTARAPGEAAIRATSGALSTDALVRIVESGSDVLPNVDVFPDRTYQTISGWESAASVGEFDCHPEAFRRYVPEVLSRAVNELGITRVRLGLRTGAESSRNPMPDFLAGRLPYRDWRATWFVAENDNDDPFVADSTRFHWDFLDRIVETVVLPLRERLSARGEQLFVNLNVVDFFLGASAKAFSQFNDPEEYAELILATFQHLDRKYGLIPDGVEILLEPENTPHSAVSIGRAIVATVARLEGAGYRPRIIAPSTTRASNAALYYDSLMAVPGVAGLIDEISYHRYTGVSRPVLEAIATRARRDGIDASMLEYIGAGFEEFYEDLTIANVTAWGQFSLAYCGRRRNLEARGIYFQVDQSTPTAPVVSITHVSRLLRQVFMYVRPGAVRLGAVSSHAAIRPLAFRNRNGRSVVTGWTTGAASFAIRGLPAGSYGINYSVTGGAWNREMPAATIAGGELLRVEMPAAGVVTIYGR
jgi:hypothetical protein